MIYFLASFLILPFAWKRQQIRIDMFYPDLKALCSNKAMGDGPIERTWRHLSMMPVFLLKG